ncbi:MAG: hypothetical protein ACJAYU_000892 [Bradymonadia bacterium]|jgi:hypothetical protein
MMGGEGGASGGNGEFGGAGGPASGPLDQLPEGIAPEVGVGIGDAFLLPFDVGTGDGPILDGDFDGLCCYTAFCEEIDAECAFVCGNGIVEEPETCDGDCEEITCQDAPVCDLVVSYDVIGDPDLCAVECYPTEIRECESDGCCPEYCNYTNDGDCDVITGGVGSACDVDTDCGDPEEGHFCVNEGYRAGYCSFDYFEAAGACPVGSHVTDIWVLTGWDPDILCAADCETDEDCGGRVGYECFDRDLDGITECAQVGIGEKEYDEECQDTTQCAGGDYAHCDPYGGSGDVDATCSFFCREDGVLDCPEGLHCFGTRCFEPCETCLDGDGCCPNEFGCFFEVDDDCPEPGDDVVGRPCTTVADCGDPIATCLTAEDGFPGGYCTYSVNDIAICPEGSYHASARGRDDITCREECSSDTDCRSADYECYDYTAVFSRNFMCSPVGNGSTPIGGSCTRTDQCAGGRYVFCGEWNICEQGCLGPGRSAEPVLCPDEYECSAFFFACREGCEDGICPPGYECLAPFSGDPATCEHDDF